MSTIDSAKKAIKVNAEDNLAVALTNLKKGEIVKVEDQSYTLVSDVKVKHKFAIKDFAVNEKAIMYGVTAGVATSEIKQGEVVTLDNLKHAADGFDRKKEKFQWTPPNTKDLEKLSFKGFKRSDGRIGTANHWLVVPLVFCENRNLLTMREAMLKALGYGKNEKYTDLSQRLVHAYKSGKKSDELLEMVLASDGSTEPSPLFPNVDGLKFLWHDGGCGGTRDDARVLCGLLAGYIVHPNVAGVTVLSLGCQNAQIKMLKEEIHKRSPHFDKPTYFFEQQQMPSEETMVTEAIKKTFIGLMEANKAKRETFPISKLVVGVECGASDGFSGISANPTIGQVSDFVVAMGGSAILSEFPELCGVEQEMVNRCVDQEAADKFVSLMRAYEKAAIDAGASFDMNPSPGNIKDGLITDAMKSAGACKKGGTSTVMDVLDYPERVTKKGLNLLCTPGNDVESTTGLAGAGANVILFSTGLGTPTGNPIVPVIKVSSNSEVASRLKDIIDFDSGPIVQGEKSIFELGKELLEETVEVASGKQTKAMLLGQEDFILWKRGVSL